MSQLLTASQVESQYRFIQGTQAGTSLVVSTEVQPDRELRISEVQNFLESVSPDAQRSL